MPLAYHANKGIMHLRRDSVVIMNVECKGYPGRAVAILLCGSSAVSNAQTLPPYVAPIAGKTAATPSDIATKDVLALNTGMFELYGEAAKIFQNNILSRHPVILGLFSGAGGKLIPYRPGMPPIEAPPAPSSSHSLKSLIPPPLPFPR